jgi:hypothetical protein
VIRSLVDPAANVDFNYYNDALFLVNLEKSPVIADTEPVNGILNPDEISGMRKILQSPEVFADSLPVREFLEVFLGLLVEKNLVGHNLTSL